MSGLSECVFVVWLGLVKCSLFEEMSEIRRPIADGRCLIIVGGWLELVLT